MWYQWRRNRLGCGRVLDVGDQSNVSTEPLLGRHVCVPSCCCKGVLGRCALIGQCSSCCNLWQRLLRQVSGMASPASHACTIMLCAWVWLWCECATGYRVSLKQSIHRYNLLRHGLLVLTSSRSQLLVPSLSFSPLTDSLPATAQALSSSRTETQLEWWYGRYQWSEFSATPCSCWLAGCLPIFYSTLRLSI